AVAAALAGHVALQVLDRRCGRLALQAGDGTHGGQRRAERGELVADHLGPVARLRDELALVALDLLLRDRGARLHAEDRGRDRFRRAVVRLHVLGLDEAAGRHAPEERLDGHAPAALGERPGRRVVAQETLDLPDRLLRARERHADPGLHLRRAGGGAGPWRRLEPERPRLARARVDLHEPLVGLDDLPVDRRVLRRGKLPLDLGERARPGLGALEFDIARRVVVLRLEHVLGHARQVRAAEHGREPAADRLPGLCAAGEADAGRLRLAPARRQQSPERAGGQLRPLDVGLGDRGEAAAHDAPVLALAGEARGLRVPLRLEARLGELLARLLELEPALAVVARGLALRPGLAALEDAHEEARNALELLARGEERLRGGEARRHGYSVPSRSMYAGSSASRARRCSASRRRMRARSSSATWPCLTAPKMLAPAPRMLEISAAFSSVLMPPPPAV